MIATFIGIPSIPLDELAEINQSLMSATLNDECSACQYLFGEDKEDGG
jgi:hypothetical protein